MNLSPQHQALIKMIGINGLSHPVECIKQRKKLMLYRTGIAIFRLDPARLELTIKGRQLLKMILEAERR